MKVRLLCHCFLSTEMALLVLLFAVTTLSCACQDLKLSELSFSVPAAA